MGVDFFPCHYCDEAICDCGEYQRCACGKTWCNSECSDQEGYKEREDSCNFCRMEDAEDWELVNFLLKKANLTREQAVKMYYTEYLPYEGN